MAWSDPQPAFHAVDADGNIVRPRTMCINPSSVSIVRDPDGTDPDLLRFYNVTVGDINNGMDCALGDHDDYLLYATDTPACRARFEALDVSDPYICYMDNVLGLDEVWIFPDAYSMDRLIPTCIPRFREITDFAFVRIAYDDGTTAVERATSVFQYGGVNVVQLPPSDGRWMMLMHRARMRRGDEGEARYEDYEDNPRNFIGENTAPQTCASDIIAYIADDSTFTTGVVGPFWIVDSKNALATDVEVTANDGSTTIPARFYLGVPSAVVIGTDIYVYYVYERSEYFDMGGDDNGGDTGQNLYNASVSTRTQGIAVKQFALAELLRLETLAQLPATRTLLAERNWEQTQHNTALDPVIQGTLLGPIEVYVTGRRSSGAAWELFTDVFPNPTYDADSWMALIDPAAVWCSGAGGTGLSLFFASDWRSETNTYPDANARRTQDLDYGQLWDGYGTWHARTVAGLGTFALTFAIRITWSADELVRNSADQVARVEVTQKASDRNTHDPGYGRGPFQNPEVTRLADGTVRVQTGGTLQAVAMNALFFGTERDVCPPVAAGAAALLPQRPPPLDSRTFDASLESLLGVGADDWEAAT